MLTKNTIKKIHVEFLRAEGDWLVSGDRRIPAERLLDSMVDLQIYLARHLGEVLDREIVRAGVKHLLASPHIGQFLIAWSGDGRIVGQVEVKKIFEVWDNAPYWYLDNYVVAPEFQRMGIGARLVEAARRLGKAQGVKCLRLYVAHDNPDAKRFYIRNGFSSHGDLMECSLRAPAL